jgi:hypothetical protein
MFYIISKIFGGWKSFFVGIFATALITFFFSHLREMIQEVLNFGLSKIAELGIFDAVTVDFTGFAAWMLQQFRLADCLTIILSTVLLKWTLRKIPFIRW